MKIQRAASTLTGLAVTIGLLTYNARNDQLYDELVGRAAEIERRLGLPDGAFATRPTSWLRFGAWSIDPGALKTDSFDCMTFTTCGWARI